MARAKQNQTPVCIDCRTELEVTKTIVYTGSQMRCADCFVVMYYGGKPSPDVGVAAERSGIWCPGYTHVRKNADKVDVHVEGVMLYRGYDNAEEGLADVESIRQRGTDAPG